MGPRFSFPTSSQPCESKDNVFKGSQWVRESCRTRSFKITGPSGHTICVRCCDREQRLSRGKKTSEHNPRRGIRLRCKRTVTARVEQFAKTPNSPVRSASVTSYLVSQLGT